MDYKNRRNRSKFAQPKVPPLQNQGNSFHSVTTCCHLWHNGNCFTRAGPAIAGFRFLNYCVWIEVEVAAALCRDLLALRLYPRCPNYTGYPKSTRSSKC
jgi:hypothetical protein